MVEIGMGREARRTYELEDVAIVPSRRTRSSKDVDARWSIDAYEFGFPLMMHPTDSVSGPESAAEFACLGGLAVSTPRASGAPRGRRRGDREGRRGRVHVRVAGRGRGQQGPPELHSALIDEDLLVRRITELR